MSGTFTGIPEGLPLAIEKLVEQAVKESDSEEAFYERLTEYVANLNADIDYRLYKEAEGENPDFPPDGSVYNLFWKPEPTLLLFAAVKKQKCCRFTTWGTFLEKLPSIVKATEGGCFKRTGSGRFI